MYKTNPIFFSKRISLGLGVSHYHQALEARLCLAEDRLLKRFDDYNKTVAIMEWSLEQMRNSVREHL